MFSSIYFLLKCLEILFALLQHCTLSSFPPAGIWLAGTCRGFCSCNTLCLTYSSYATTGHSQASFRGLQCIYQYNGEITICHTYQMTLCPYSISAVVLDPLCSVCLLEMVQVSNAWGWVPLKPENIILKKICSWSVRILCVGMVWLMQYAKHSLV